MVGDCYKLFQMIDDLTNIIFNDWMIGQCRTFVIGKKIYLVISDFLFN